MAASSERVLVAVRVRPGKPGSQGTVVQPEKPIGKQYCTNITTRDPNTADSRRFTYDYAMQSGSPSGHGFVSQEKLFELVGAPVLQNALSGFNACVFAYGQTGSGKTHTMMGPQDDPGLIPRLCEALFSNLSAHEAMDATVEASYCEVYNERVYDLLSANGSEKPLRVREHRLLGPYVEGLTHLAVTDFDMIRALFRAGNDARHTARTAMNDTSSRSHAIFAVKIKLEYSEDLPGMTPGQTRTKMSKVNLVDLAGSERQSKAESSGMRLKEGSNINKSLSMLGLVISGLAKKTSSGKGDTHVPYRNSILTWLLKDSLGGNSKTVMVATVSPAASNFEETMSTLKYAERAKKIMNKPVVNEAATSQEIGALKAEIEELKEQLLLAEKSKEQTKEIETLNEKLNQNEQLLSEMNMTWEERMAQTRKELERVAEEAKKRADAAERQTAEVKRELSMHRHESRKAINKVAAGFRAKEVALRKEAEKKAAALKKQLMELQKNGNINVDVAKGGTKTLPTPGRARNNLNPVNKPKVVPGMANAVQQMEEAITKVKEITSPTKATSTKKDIVGKTAPTAIYKKLTFGVSDNKPAKFIVPPQKSAEEKRKQKKRVDSRLASIEAELTAIEELTKAQLKHGSSTTGSELNAALTAVRKRSAVLEVRREMAVSELSHLDEGIESGGESTSAPKNVEGWRLAQALQTAQEARSRHEMLDARLQKALTSAAKVARTATTAGTTETQRDVVPLLNNVVGDIGGLVEDLNLAQNHVVNAEQRADTQLMWSLRQREADGQGNYNRAEEELQSVVKAREERDRLDVEANMLRSEFVVQLGELRDILHTEKSTAADLAPVERLQDKLDEMMDKLRHASSSIAAKETNVGRQVLQLPNKSKELSTEVAPAPKRPGKVLHTFNGDSKMGQLAVTEGETVEVVDRINENWYYCSSKAGKSGLVPCSFLETSFESIIAPSDSMDMSFVIGLREENQYDSYKTSHSTLRQVFDALSFNDCTDLTVAMQRYDNAVITVDEVQALRAKELRSLWMLAEERRALEAALRCAKPGQFSPVHGRISEIQAATDQSYQRCRHLAALSGPATQRVGKTKQCVKVLETLEGYSPSVHERIFQADELLKHVRRDRDRLQAEWSKIKEPLKSQENIELKDLYACIEGYMDQVNAVVTKAEHNLVRDIIQAWNSPTATLDNTILEQAITRRIYDKAGLVDCVLNVGQERLIEQIANEMVEEHSLLHVNILTEEQKKVRNRSEVVRSEKAVIMAQARKNAEGKSGESQEGRTRRENALKALSTEEHAYETHNQALELALKTTQAAAAAAVEALSGGESDSSADVATKKKGSKPTSMTMLQKIIVCGQRVLLQDAVLKSQLVQMSSLDWNNPRSACDAVEVLNHEEYERLVQSLVQCHLRIHWMSCGKADIGFERLLNEYAVQVYQYQVSQNSTQEAIRKLLSSLKTRAKLNVVFETLSEDFAEASASLQTLINKLQNSPEPGSSFRGAFLEASGRLSQMVLTRAYSRMAITTAKAMVLFAQYKMNSLESPSQPTRRESASKTSSKDAKGTLPPPEDPRPTIEKHMEVLETGILKNPDIQKRPAQADSKRNEITVLRQSFKNKKSKKPSKGVATVVKRQADLQEYVRTLFPHLQSEEVFYTRASCSGQLTLQKDDEPDQVLWCVLNVDDSKFQCFESKTDKSKPFVDIDTNNIISAVHLSKNENEDLNDNSTFMIVTAENIYHFKASSPAAMSSWVGAMSAVSLAGPSFAPHLLPDDNSKPPETSEMLAKKLALGKISLSEYQHISVIEQQLYEDA
eukprot:m.25147 g.25147  ORF g.25147 m.25147 type:complete len:1801 (+) comp7680_c0_seq2:357-5759(+)